MIDITRFSNVVACIHSCAGTPDNWSRAMREIAHLMGATGGVAIIDGLGTRRVLTHTCIAADAQLDYCAHYHSLDHVLTAVQTGPVGAVRSGAELIWPYHHREFIHDWALPNGFGDGLFIRMTADERSSAIAVSTSRRNHRFDSPENIDALRGVAAHVVQARQLQRVLYAAASTGGTTQDGAVRYGLLNVSANSHIVFASSSGEAILRDDDGIRIRSGRLQAMLVRDDFVLQHAVNAAAGSCGRVGRSLRCRRRGPRSPLIVHVAPAAERYAAITIIDPDVTPVPSSDALRDLFGLTRSEVLVAQSLLARPGLQAVAERLVVSPTTVKSHLVSIFRKTGVNRQADLVRLLSTLDPLCSTASSSANRRLSAKG